MAIFGKFTRLLDTILLLAEAVESLAKAQTSATPSADRLDALELSRHAFEAQMEGLFLKADGKLRAASNAEARERKLKESYEKDLDSFDPPGDPESGASPILPDHVETSAEERLSALHLGLAPNHKASALAHKFGR